jgi:hypothetical protein
MSNRRFPMVNKTTLALSIALALFGSSLARANGDGDDHDRYSSNWSAGQGATPVYAYSPAGSNAYGSAPPVRVQRPASKHSHYR